MWLKLSCRKDSVNIQTVPFRVVRFALHSAGTQLNHVVMQI